MQPFLFMASHVVFHTNPAIKVAHVMPRLTCARWCACPTDYMNKLEYVRFAEDNWKKR